MIVEKDVKNGKSGGLQKAGFREIYHPCVTPLSLFSIVCQIIHEEWNLQHEKIYPVLLNND